jgi:hypothetical protein
MPKLWLVKINHDDFEYDCFVSAVVWAETAKDAEGLIRERETSSDGGLPRGDQTRLIVEPAPDAGVVHVHWHAG